MIQSHWAGSLQWCSATGQGQKAQTESRKFHLRMRKNFCPLRMTEHWNGLPILEDIKYYQIFQISGDIWNPCGRDPMQVAVGERALAGGWRSRGAFQPWPFCGSVIDSSTVKTVTTHSCRKLKAAGALGSDSLTKVNLNGKFCSICCPTALLPQVPTPKLPTVGGRLGPAVLLHPDLDLHLLSVPGSKLTWFAAGLATAPRVVISEIRWDGQPCGFGSPALLPFSSRINFTCLSDRYGLKRQNAGADTRLLWSGARQMHTPSRWGQLWRMDLLCALLSTNNPHSLESKPVLRAFPLQHWCSYILT